MENSSENYTYYYAHTRLEVKMTKVLKRAAAAVMALVIMVSATACSGDKSWSAKKDNTTLPIGFYIFDLYMAYSQASSKVPDSTKPILNQKIDNKDASTWIKDTAMTEMKTYFVVEQKMKELGISLTSDETKSAESEASSAWSNYGTTLQGYGISQKSFSMAYSEFSTKKQKLFKALYGKGGKSEVSDTDLKSYFEKSYTDFNYFYAPLYTQDATTGSSTALGDDKVKAIKKELDNYVAQINSGKMTIQQAAEAYKKSSKATEDPLQSATTILATGSNASDFEKLLASATVGQAKAGTVQNCYVVYIKNDITKKTSSQISASDKRESILEQMKYTEFTDMLKSEAAKISGVSINDAAVNEQSLSKFVSSTSSAASATASK